MTEMLRKYPRTRHLEGSRLQPGDEDLDAVRFAELGGAHVVVEEKLDGANAGISFTPGGDLRLQSRGHFLTGGRRERHFALFKKWANAHKPKLWQVLGDRYVVYGEWLYAKHTVFYDRLPHYFLEFDILDLATVTFLSTRRRRALLGDGPLASVPVLWTGPAPRRQQVEALVTRSLYKSPLWAKSLAATTRAEGLDVARVREETDPSDDSEGLYVKAETEDAVVGRFKYVRASFLTSVVDSGSHWLDRPIVPNGLAPGVDLFGRGGGA